MASNTQLNPLNKDTRVAVIGLGYVGLPLAHALGKIYPTVGYDINRKRVAEINRGIDSNNELAAAQFSETLNIEYSDDPDCLKDCDIYIVTTATPVDQQNQPDLEPVKVATQLAASYLQPGNIVVFESTVYPGATEEECVPLLSKISGLRYNTEFFVGYSPGTHPSWRHRAPPHLDRKGDFWLYTGSRQIIDELY